MPKHKRGPSKIHTVVLASLSICVNYKGASPGPWGGEGDRYALEEEQASFLYNVFTLNNRGVESLSANLVPDI